MPRDLQQSDRNEMKIQDAISGDEIVLYYSLPTTTQRIGFQKSCWKRDGNKIISRIPEARAKFGAEILTGIRPGDFTVGGQPIASTPGTEDYREDWKALVMATAGDLVMTLAQQVFEGAHQAVPTDIEIVDGSEGEGDDILPLE